MGVNKNEIIKNEIINIFIPVVKKDGLEYNRGMNWDLLGHQWAVNLLREHIVKDRVRHAYLFTGPRGVGRRTLALRYSQALICPQPTSPGVACQSCSTCQRIAKSAHPDLVVVQAEAEGGNMKVDQIRELQRTLSLSPYEASYKIALLLRFEEANPNAANALLKSLEEPPRRVLLFLTAESGDNLLPTIVSRCEVIRLAPLSLDVICEGLQERLGLPFEQARLLAHLSNGRYGYAVRLYQEPEQLEKRQVLLDDLYNLHQSNRINRFSYAEALSKDKENIRQALLVWLSLYRDVMLRTAGASTALTNLDRIEQIENMASKMKLEKVHGFIIALERTLGLLDRNVNPRLAVEVLMLDLPRH
jgi:DNA polymerase III subunit delta'